ncbi:MAG: hypothetical protein EBT79_02245 [Actinobacteria bacterium]|nr:hypothetical protein [Actinomycetota bacterium]NBR66095.1 hypothetical protein [Actinomycetota bacterium]
MSRLITAQRTPNILVSNIEGAGDPSLGLNPVKVRTGFARQNLPEVSRIGGVYTRIFEYGRNFDRRSPGTHTLLGKLTGSYVRASVDITVIDNDFSDAATLFIGDYSFTSGVDFVVGGGVNATATAIAAAIDGINGYAASAVGPVVTVTVPPGPNGDNTFADAEYVGTVRNYTLAPNTWYLSGGQPYIGPPDILP